MSKPRYFISSNLNKLEDAHVCFRYWSNHALANMGPMLSVVRKKIRKEVFAIPDNTDHILSVHNVETGFSIQRGEEGFEEALRKDQASKYGEAWVATKLGKDWAPLMCAFMEKFAKNRKISATTTQKPLITMALSKDDWKKVKMGCSRFNVLAVEATKKLVAPEDPMLQISSMDMIGPMLDPQDKAGLANCVELIEVNKNGEPLK